MICSDDAVFRQGFLNVGLSVDGGGSWLLPRLVGPAMAKQLLFDDERLDAARARALGLVSEVVAPTYLEARVREQATRLAAGPPLALTWTKKLIHTALEGSFEDALAAEARSQTALARTEDSAEGRRAFRERRSPHFKGR